MDDGGYGKVIYDFKPYQINDEREYFSVWKDYKQIASFKDRQDALEFVQWREANLK